MSGTKRIFLSFLCLYCWCFCFTHAREFLLGDRELLTPSTQVVIDKIGLELAHKTPISAYAIVKDSLDASHQPSTKAQREAFMQEALKDLKAPYFALFFIKLDKKIAFYVSKDLEGRVDLENIYDTYVVPLLPVKNSDVLDIPRVSAIVLNGYVHFADAFAKVYGERVASDLIDRTGDLLAKIARVALILMLVSLVVIFIWRVFWRKNGSK